MFKKLNSEKVGVMLYDHIAGKNVYLYKCKDGKEFFAFSKFGSLFFCMWR